MGKSNQKSTWRLYDSITKNFFDDLKLPQLLNLIKSISKNDLAKWYVCDTEDPEWIQVSRKIDKFLKLPMEDNTMEIVGLGTFVGNRTLTGASNTLANLEVEHSEKRKVSRVEKKLGVFVDVGGQILQASTKDISILAMKLDKSFSIKYQNTYPVILKANPVVELRCTPIINESEFKKGLWNRLRIHPNYNLSKLVTLLSIK